MSDVSVCFLLQDLCLSGGVGVVVKHARGLAVDHGVEVTIAVSFPHYERWSGHQLDRVEVITLAEAEQREFDIAVATWWETAYELFRIPARRYAHFVQSLEDRFYAPDRPERAMAAVSLAMPCAFITEATWIEQTLRQVRPDTDCYLVRNGIDKEVFRIPDQLDVRTGGPLRIVVEGIPGVGHKGVAESIDAITRMSEPFEATFVSSEPLAFGSVKPPGEIVGPLSLEQMSDLYAQSDVVLKMSSVEGMYGPPLEGFHRGATCVTTPVTGHEEFVRHRWNGVVVDWDDIAGTARWLDTLACDRRLLHFLRLNAVHTARGWPAWSQSTQFMDAALRALARSPAPPPRDGVSYAIASLRADLPDLALQNQWKVSSAEWMINLRYAPAKDLVAQWERLRGSPLELIGASLRALARRGLAGLARPFVALARRVRGLARR